MIEVEDLRVRFGDREAVRGVSFAVPSSGSFGLVGESGSGKSTVLRALSGLNPAWTGRMALDGAALAPRRTKDFYRRVQMVFQDPFGSLHPRQTVDRALSEPLVVHGLGDLDVEVAVEARVDPALQADLRRAEPGGLLAAVGDVLQREQVGGAAQVE